MEINPTIIISIISVMIAITSLIVAFISGRDRRKADIINAQKFISERLYELDKLSITYPELQKRLTDISVSKEFDSYIKKLQENGESFHKLKSFVYIHINIYDELVNLFEREEKIREYLEYDFWRRYIMYRMENPLFEAIYKAESKYFWGNSLKTFMTNCRNDKQLMEDIKEMKDSYVLY